VSTPPGGNSGSPPPASTPKPSATKPPKAVTIPPTSSGSSGSSRSSGSSGFSGSSGGSSGSSGGSGGSSGGSGGSGGSSGRSGGSSGKSGGSSGGSGGGGTETTPKPASTEITLDGDPVETYDPFGNGPENDTAVEDAIDGDGANTYWETEQYPGGDLGKDGVGLVLRTATAESARSLLLRTPTPGFATTIYAARDTIPGGVPGGWTELASDKSVDSTTRLKLATDGKRFRYYLVWITKLPAGEQSAKISNLKLFD